MQFDPAIMLAALGITLLEMSEASAMGMALYADSRRASAYGAVILGVITVMIPTVVAGNYIALLPVVYVRIASATLLLYFGIRLIRSARRSFRFQRIGPPKDTGKHDEVEKGIMFTGYSVGLVEAFEAAIVLIALFPQNFDSTGIGVVTGGIIVVISAYILRSQIRKVKQATVKTGVSSLLLSFSLFWYVETFYSLNDLFLFPIFIVFYLIVYSIATAGIPRNRVERTEVDAE